MFAWFIWLVIGATIVDGFAYTFNWSIVKKWRYSGFFNYMFYSIISNSFWTFVIMVAIKLVMWVFS
jgi:hypothetical protein